MQLKVLILISLVFATLAAAASFPTPTNSANLEDSFRIPSPSSEVHSNQNRGFIDFVTSLLEDNPDDNGATVVHPF